MNRRLRLRTLLLAAWLLVAIAGCGQMGPLTLPEDAQNGADEDQSDDEDER